MNLLWQVVFMRASLRILSILLVACGFNQLRAAVNTWDGQVSGINPNWTGTFTFWIFTFDNWSGGIPANDGSTDIHFAGTRGTSPNMDVSYDIHSLTFDSGAAAFNLVNSSGTTLTLEGGGMANNSANVQSVNISSVTLNASQTWNAGNVAGGSLALGGSSLNLGVNHVLTIDGANGATINNAISGTGASGITKNGTGTLTLNHANSYAGGTTLNAGTLALGADNALGSGAFTFAGGILQANDHSASLGALTLSADSTLDLTGDPNTHGTLAFDSASWTAGTLTILGADDDLVTIASDPGATFLSHVQFDVGGVLFGSLWDPSTHELYASSTPVPEPIEWALIVFGGLAGVAKLGRFRSRAVKDNLRRQ